jgi:hypothetical protein
LAAAASNAPAAPTMSVEAKDCRSIILCLPGIMLVPMYRGGKTTGAGRPMATTASQQYTAQASEPGRLMWRAPLRETMEKLQAAVKGTGMTVFAEIDHAAGVAEAGLALRPTGLLVFGHARGGTPLMQAVQTIGVAGRRRRHVAVLRRTRLASEAAWVRMLDAAGSGLRNVAWQRLF